MWVPLHVHSEYSILDAFGSVGALAKKAKALNFPALALTDHGSMFGSVDFFKACKKEGIQPIIGLAAYVAPESRLDRMRIPGMPAGFDLVLLAKNEQGYHNLCKLTSKGHLEGFYYYPRIDRELLKEHAEGLVCLSGNVGSHAGHLALNCSQEEFLEGIKWYQELFGEDYYLELQRHEMSEEDLHSHDMMQETWLTQQYDSFIERQKEINKKFLEASSKLGIRYVATNDSHYLNPEEWRAHEILLNISSGEPCEIWETDAQGNRTFRIPNPKRRTYPTHEFYFKSAEQMQALFSDLPEALSTTLEVMEKCQCELDFKTKHYPVYLPPAVREKEVSAEEQAQAVIDYLRALCEEGIPKRYTEKRLEKIREVYPDQEPMDVVTKRLDRELEVIRTKALGDYLLIVWDFIHWAKSNRIPVGPGRGSGAGSIILYLIGITDIEPLRFNLFFERFINPERMSYPDIDVDICMDNRGKVIDYTVDTYGKDNVAQIITFGTMKAKMVVKDVGRVLSVPLPKVNAIAKLIPEELGITLEKALEVDPELAQQYETDEETKRVLDFGRQLEGTVRNTGIHAAGVIISGDPLTEHIPLCRAKDSDLAATQYSMKPVESVGMLKVDFLGLKTLTCIQICVDAIKRNHGVDIDWMNLPLDDKVAFDLLNQGETMGIFQMESGGMQDLARQLHLDKFEEIIAVLSLYRPGPMDMIPSFIARKHGHEPIEYDHPWMKEILSETYGIMVYQEQVMQIASKLANYSMGEGDVLRRAMGKKDHQQMAEQREKFRQGALDNDIDEETSMAIFDKMEKFASYGFNKSHAAAYGYITYVTAVLKARYPKEWMAALMTSVRDDTTKVAKFIAESQHMGIPILPPDVNYAGSEFAASDEGVCFAISGIKGVGSGVVEEVVEEREKNGPYKSFYNFISRVNPKKVGKKAIESMVDAGCFDFTKWTRDEMRTSLDSMYSAAVKERKDREAGVMSLFSMIPGEDEGRFAHPPKEVQARSQLDLLLKEKELLGFFLTGHPMALFKEVLLHLSCVTFKQIAELHDPQVVRAAFFVETVATRIASKSQKKFAILTISDGWEHFELPIWPELYEKSGHLLRENRLLYAVLSVEKKEGTTKLNCAWLDDLSQANESMIALCDAAFDKEKSRMARAQFMRAQAGERKAKKEGKEAQKVQGPVEIYLDADQLRLTQVLTLKEWLKKYPGDRETKVHFRSEEKVLATLHLGKRVGALQKDKARIQKELPFVTEVKG